MGEPFHSIGAELGSAAPCPTITLGGKTWHVGWPTQRARAQLEGLVIEAAKRNLDDAKDFLGEEDYQRERAALQKAIIAGQWRTWGELWATVVQGRESNAIFLLSLLREKHPEATWQDAETLWSEAADEVVEAFARVVPNFLSLLVEKSPGTTPAEKATLTAQFTQAVLSGIRSLQQKAPGNSSGPTTP